ncbi:hypothetical protein BDW71DRAFT_171127 [Aspergillus fruticulosus]
MISLALTAQCQNPPRLIIVTSVLPSASLAALTQKQGFPTPISSCLGLRRPSMSHWHPFRHCQSVFCRSVSRRADHASIEQECFTQHGSPGSAIAGVLHSLLFFDVAPSGCSCEPRCAYSLDAQPCEPAWDRGV